MEHTYVGATKEVQELLEQYESTPLKNGCSLAELIRRPELNYELLAPLDKKRPELPEDVREQVNINIKYDGYIKRQMKQVEQFKKLETKKLPEELDYEAISGLRIEARQENLEEYRPVSVGQASRIAGVYSGRYFCPSCVPGILSKRGKWEYMNYDLTLLENAVKEFKITLSEEQKAQFIQYYELLIEWNKVMNLTGITEFDEVLQKHFADSLSVVRALDMSKIESCIDVGTGAGFPGIPLKIAFPHLKVTLLDSLNKRLKFLNEVIEKLGLEGIETVHGRAEDGAKKPELREAFDLSVTRAVARVSVISEYCLPYVKTGGYFAAYKSGKAAEELEEGKKAIAVLGGKVEKTEEFLLPDSDMERTILLIKKVKNTPKKYPRKAGTPAKEPIV